MEVVRELSSWLLLGSGGALCVAGGIGLLRLPDVYARMHGAGLIDSGGAALILIGLMLQPAHWTVVVKLAVILFFLYVTSATATHALAHAAYTSGVEPFESRDSNRRDADEHRERDRQEMTEQ
jgi:multicomponent Na+:H+ antiporter subunit G